MSNLLSPNPLITSLSEISPQALQELRNYLEINPPTIPIQNISGFTNFQWQASNNVNTQQGTSSLTYVDLAGPGPALGGLSDGNYIFFFGFQTPDTGGRMSPSLNLATPSDTNAACAQDVTFTGGANEMLSVSRGLVLQIAAGGGSTLKMQYRSDGINTGTFANRWLVGIKYANLR